MLPSTSETRPWRSFTNASYCGSSTVYVSECTMRSSVSSVRLWPNFASRTFWALTDSGEFVNWMSWVRTSARYLELSAPMAAIRTSHTPIVRQG